MGEWTEEMFDPIMSPAGAKSSNVLLYHLRPMIEEELPGLMWDRGVGDLPKCETLFEIATFQSIRFVEFKRDKLDIFFQRVFLRSFNSLVHQVRSFTPKESYDDFGCGLIAKLEVLRADDPKNFRLGWVAYIQFIKPDFRFFDVEEEMP